MLKHIKEFKGVIDDLYEMTVTIISSQGVRHRVIKLYYVGKVLRAGTQCGLQLTVPSDPAKLKRECPTCLPKE